MSAGVVLVAVLAFVAVMVWDGNRTAVLATLAGVLLLVVATVNALTYHWLPPSASKLVLTLDVAVVVVAAVILIVWAPHWLATGGLHGNEEAQEVGRNRTAVIASLAGLLAVVGAIYTARTFSLNRQTYEHARETTRQSHELDQARLTTERFTRAVDQLGNEKLDVRLGGIYALERLARESCKDHGPIVECLTAFVREPTRRPASTEKTSVDVQEDPAAQPMPPIARANEATAVRNSPTTDVQAALTVLGRRRLEYDTDRRLDLGDAVLVGANLAKAKLQEAFLRSANLQGAILSEANLQGAKLGSANLREAGLRRANLQEAGLRGANLRKAILSGANLQGAILRRAKLQGADLQQAKLQGADLQHANMQGAICNRETSWPEELDPSARGAVRRGGD